MKPVSVSAAEVRNVKQWQKAEAQAKEAVARNAKRIVLPQDDDSLERAKTMAAQREKAEAARKAVLDLKKALEG
jgi:hypothetical protein